MSDKALGDMLLFRSIWTGKVACPRASGKAACPRPSNPGHPTRTIAKSLLGIILLTCRELAVPPRKGLPMSGCPATSLLAALQTLTDARRPRGIRHPFPSALALIFLALPCPQPDSAALPRSAPPRLASR